MIPPEREAEVLRLHHAEHWRVGTIARQLGLHHDTVQRILAAPGQVPGLLSVRASMVDPFVPLIRETLEKFPTLRASRLYEMARARGYAGGPDHFRHVVARHRPRPAAEAFLRLRTLPGEQAQVDWGHFGRLPCGRPLWAFVLVLSYSRRIFLHFFPGLQMAYFLAGHVGAFEALAGVARVILYDNLKSAVLERAGQAIHFHPMLLELAAHYHFEPRPVAVARGNEKGRVERAIRYVRDSFFAAREFADLHDLNAQAQHWCEQVAAERPCPEDRTRRVIEVFAEEQPRLLALPDNPFPCQERIEVSVGRTPYVRFDHNDYSLPHTHVRRRLSVLATLDTVRILDGPLVLATHVRSWGKAQQIENPEHIAALLAQKRAAREHRGLDRLHHSCSHATAFFTAVAERNGNLGATTSGLTRLLDLYGGAVLNCAMAAAMLGAAPHLQAVRQILEQQRHAQNQPPPLAVSLPDDPRVKDIVVEPHALEAYDHIASEDDDD